MKLVRYGAPGAEKPGLVDESGAIRDLSGVVPDIAGAVLLAEGLAKLRRLKAADLPLVSGKPRLGMPVGGVRKCLCIGLNYKDHADEVGMALPDQPIVFTKPLSALCGPNEPTVMPKDSKNLDWEVELTVVIGKPGRYIDEGRALDHVAGYCVGNDVSERKYQMHGGGGQWTKGKVCDTFGPVGPWLVTADEVPDPQNLDMWCDVNGTRMQTGNTRTMIFGVKPLIAELSRYMTLETGDLIMTGTPPGVGSAKKPTAIFLKVGDVVTLGIQGMGEQRQEIVAWDRATKAA